jgi:PAS domain-containing protein
MSRLDVHFLDQGLHRVLFDAMPLPVFVVDQAVNILECNAAAARLLTKDDRPGQHRRGGDLLHCLHATETPEGCGGAPACADCQLRKAVRAAARGRSVNRQWAEMVLMQEGKAARVSLRISCQPFTYEKSSFVLLVLEGLNN